jgi:hypothetical protein
LTILAELTFLTPLGGLLAVAVVLPVAAYVAMASRSTRGRALLRLAPPKPDHSALAALASVPLLLGVAAAQPALRTHAGHRIRTDAQAIFVFDTSRSMAASAARGSPTRLAQAQEAAISLRDDALAEVPSGLASLTTQLLPHLFPTPDAAAFSATVANAIGIEKPPPPALKVGLPGTSFWPLTALRDQGYFDPKTKRRVVILMTDGESGPYPVAAVTQAFRKPVPPLEYPGLPPQPPQAPISLVVVRFGGAHDRIYGTDGTVEAAYRPDPSAAETVRSLADATGGKVFTASDLPAARAALRTMVGSGHGATRGANLKTIDLAPYIVLVAFAPLALLIRRRNLVAL